MTNQYLDVLDAATRRLCARTYPVRRSDPFAAQQRAAARLQRAQRLFPGLSDQDALDRLADFDADKAS